MKRTFLALSLLLLLPHAFAQQPAGRPTPRPWSAGVFAFTDSQPYRGASGQTRVFPFISYRSERLQWFGPFLRVKAAEFGGWSLTARARADFGAYKEDDAEILQGLGDRKDTLLLGLGLRRSLLPGLDLSLHADREALGRHDGWESEIALSHPIGSPRDRLSGSLNFGLRHQDRAWTMDRTGVPEEKAREGRPAYQPGHSLHPFVGGQTLYKITDRWVATGILSVDRLDDAWTDSPLIQDTWTLRTVLTVAYTF